MEKILRTNYVFIDYENVQVKSLALLKAEHFRIQIFLGPKNTKLPIELVIAMQEFGNRAGYIILETSGNNALDFHIAYYLGTIAAIDATAYFHIISKDTGFDPLIQHLKSKNILCARSPCIENLPCFIAKADPDEVIKPDAKQVGKTTVKVQKKETQIESLIGNVVSDLIGRGTSRPVTVTSLRSTIRAKLGKLTSTETVDLVSNALIKKGYVVVDGSKVSYALPTL